MRNDSTLKPSTIAHEPPETDCTPNEAMFHCAAKAIWRVRGELNIGETSMTDSSDDLAVVLSRIKAFLRAEVYPLEQDFLCRPFRDLVPRLNEKRQQVKAMGLWTPHLPHEYSGLVLKVLEFADGSEEIRPNPICPLPIKCQLTGI